MAVLLVYISCYWLSDFFLGSFVWVSLGAEGVRFCLWV